MFLHLLRPMLLSLPVLALLAGSIHAQQPSVERQFALLVGCTKYLDAQIPPLDGPRNDVPLYIDLLTNTFGFPKENVTTLVGWPDDEKQRPTHKNIVAGFERLVEKSGPGVQIFILLAGHGVQVPIPATQKNPLDPRNPEPDGMDEVFLPADVQRWKEGVGLKNHILDDQIGAWLDALQAKGASVWIVFDCCHSGTMMRDVVERARQVLPERLGIPAEALEEAARLAQQAQRQLRELPVERSRSLQPPSDLLQLKNGKKGPGGVVAFYAAQPFETTPELPRPQGAALRAENYYGLLSYTLIGLLKQHHRALTYRELAQHLSAAYRGERGANGPTPFAEGDLDRQVLGVEKFPARSALVLQRKGTRLDINAGELMGLRPGSILAVRAPAGKGSPDQILGYVRVKSAEPGSAEVEPAPSPDGKMPAAKVGDFPNLARCEIAVQDVGDLRVRIAIANVAEPNPGMAKMQMLLQVAWSQLPEDVRKQVELTADPARAEWQLTPDNASVTLRRHENRTLSQAGLKAGKVVPDDYVRYEPENARELSILLTRDLQRIYTWQNLWRIAGRTTPQPGRPQLEIKVVKLGEGQEEVLTPGSMVRPDQNVKLVVTNRATRDLHVAVLLLDSRCGVLVKTASLRVNESQEVLRWTIVADPGPGAEGLIVLGMPLAGVQPNFEFLEQPSLGTGSREIDRPEQLKKAPKTPFGQLLETAAVGQGARSGLQSRGFRIAEPTNPTMLSWTWVTLPSR